MLVYAILGDPVEHSLSPAMHSAAFRALGLSACYHAFRVSPPDLGTAIAGARALGFGGLNLTIPLKERALEYLEPDQDARAMGAVNVVSFDGGVRGYNTDGRGASLALREAGFEVPGSRALLIGAGGAARALAYQLAGEGAVLTIANRSLERARELARAFGGRACPLEELRDLVPKVDLIVNATSVGMRPGDPRLFPGELLGPEQTVFDIVYNRETELIADARGAGARAIDGVMMLVYQGALAITIWTGREAPVGAMEQAVRSALAERRVQ
ncbi:MAG: shikimate dehydrogenase [Methanosarcinales archaeon]|nr:shikimate dehydrogenase [Methanosarcinales archaeon]